MQLVYVFDAFEAEGTLLPFRIPTVLARLVCRFLPGHDYSVNSWGETRWTP